jgi:hypothetical protein
MRVVPAVWPRVRRLAAVGALAIATVGLSASQASAFEPSVPESFFGISDPVLWPLTEQGRLELRDSQLPGIKAAGLDWVRTEIGWREIEPNAPQDGVHTYDWSLADNYVTALADQGLQLFPMLMPAPVWAQDPAAAAADCDRRSAVAPEYAGDYGDFAGALVRRYGAGGSFWADHPDLTPQPVTRVELWNEPNFRSFWCPAPDPETFASLVRQGADSIHAADPSVDVVLGGLAAFKTTQFDGGGLVGIGAGEFLKRMLAQDPDLASRIDAVGFHPYALDANGDLSLIAWLRQQMKSVGLGNSVDIALTEFGWHGGTSPGSLSESQRARNYLQFTDQISRTNCGVTSVAAHTWETAEAYPAVSGHWWGIASPFTGELYPSGQAYRDEVAIYEGRGPTPPPTARITKCARVTRTLAVQKAGAGTGTVTSSPSGISCGSTCSRAFNDGTVVTLTARGLSGSTFAGWSGGGCSGTGTCRVTMGSDQTVTATFDPPVQHTLTIQSAGSGLGTVTSSPSGISCGAICSHDFNEGSLVTLSAKAASGSTFAGWSGGGCSGTSSSCRVTMGSDQTVTPTFTQPTSP